MEKALLEALNQIKDLNLKLIGEMEQTFLCQAEIYDLKHKNDKLEGKATLDAIYRADQGVLEDDLNRQITHYQEEGEKLESERDSAQAELKILARVVAELDKTRIVAADRYNKLERIKNNLELAQKDPLGLDPQELIGIIDE